MGRSQQLRQPAGTRWSCSASRGWQRLRLTFQSWGSSVLPTGELGSKGCCMRACTCQPSVQQCGLLFVASVFVCEQPFVPALLLHVPQVHYCNRDAQQHGRWACARAVHPLDVSCLRTAPAPSCVPLSFIPTRPALPCPAPLLQARCRMGPRGAA